MIAHLLVFGLALAVSAGPTPAGLDICSPAVAVVIEKNEVLLRCSNDWPVTPEFVELWRVPADWNKDPRQRGTKLAVMADVRESRPTDAAYRTVLFSKDLEPGVAYYLILRRPGAPSTEGPLKIVFSTLPEATIERDKISGNWGRVFEVRSPVAISPALSVPAQRRFYEIVNAKKVPHDACTVITYKERLPATDCRLEPADPERLLNAGVARTELDSERLTQAKVGAAVDGLVNIFGEVIKAQTKPDKPIELTAPPASKEDAKWYLKFGHQKVEGSPFSLSADLKINPALARLGAFDFRPNIIVDIAANEPASANPRSSDTIKIGGDFYYLKMRDPSRRPILAGFDLKPGGNYETDREGSKKNVLGSFESQIYFRGLYKTTEQQTRRRAAKLKRSVAEVEPAKYGYAIGIFGGFEGGGSVVDQIFKNRAKTASLLVPQYSIARFWPRLRQTYEIRRITFDINAWLRYLGEVEYVGRERKDGTLELRSVKGFRFYGETAMSIALDRGKHVNFVMTWKRGGKPPKWENTNALVTGFGFIY